MPSLSLNPFMSGIVGADSIIFSGKSGTMAPSLIFSTDGMNTTDPQRPGKFCEIHLATFLNHTTKTR